MKYDLCLVFPDEATAIKMLPQCRGVLETGKEVWLTDKQNVFSLLVIGAMSTDAVYAPDGETLITPPAPIPGFHCNLQCEEDWGLDAYVVTPANRKYRWF